MKRLLACALLAACPAKPAGFSSGTGGVEDRWTLPLVGPLEDGLLVTPVVVGTTGPYLFALDPDAPITAVDGALVKRVGMRAYEGPPRYDETGGPQPRLYVEMQGMEIGSLIVEKRRAIVVKANTFDAAGRRIYGVLGADVLANGVVFGFDRDAGIATLVEDASFKPPAGAITLPFRDAAKPLPVQARHVVDARIGDVTLPLHLDLGASGSQLRDAEWTRAKLTSREVAGALVDEVGTHRKVTRASDPVAVTTGPISGRAVFLPYGDARWAEVAGTLGLGFFAPYDVWASWKARTYYLTPRTAEPITKRMTRWEQGAIDRCAQPGCVTLRMIDPLAGKPLEEGKPHPGVILSVTREERAGGMPLEVQLEVKDKPQLPLVIVNLPAHVDRMFDQLPAEFVGTTPTVVDVSPYPRDCPAALRNGCVDKLARQ